MLYSNFYKQHGTRRLSTLISPKLFVLQELPKNSILHYLTYDDIADVDVSLPYLNTPGKKVIIDFADTLLPDALGAPRRNTKLIKDLVKPFITANRSYRKVIKPYLTIKDPLTLLVENYNYLNQLYRYVELPMTTYNRWHNNQTVLWSNISTIAAASDRQHFVSIKIPDTLPNYSLLKMYSDRTNKAMMTVFNTPESLMILELWRWLSDDYRSNSVINLLDPALYSNVNLILTNSANESYILNLGYLNSWIEGQPNVTDVSDVSQFGSMQIQKFLLKSLISTHDVPEMVDPEATIAVDQPEMTQEFTEASTDDMYTVMSNVDRDIEQLEVVGTKQLRAKGIVVDASGEIQTIPITTTIDPEVVRQLALVPKSNTDQLLSMLDAHVDQGAISASDYRKLVKEITSYPEMRDPYGSRKTILEAGTITTADIQLDEEKSTIVAGRQVLDPSMLHSSLLSFDSDYINNVLHKDMLSMVGNIQQAGIAIRNYDIETNNSALGAFQIHTLELKPIDGVSSTIRFRLPVISDDSTLVANGNKMLLRKQRVDRYPYSTA